MKNGLGWKRGEGVGTVVGGFNGVGTGAGDLGSVCPEVGGREGTFKPGMCVIGDVGEKDMPLSKGVGLWIDGRNGDRDCGVWRVEGPIALDIECTGATL